MAKKYRVTLAPEERAELETLISRGKADARKLAHARVLLQVDEAPGGPGRADSEAAAALDISTRTIERVRQRFVEQGLEAALLLPTKRIGAQQPRRPPGGPPDRPGLLGASRGQEAVDPAAAGRADGGAGARRVAGA